MHNFCSAYDLATHILMKKDTDLFACLSICLLVCLFVYLSDGMFVCLPVCLTVKFIYLFIYLLFSHNKDYTSITLYKDVARGPQKTTRLVRGGPLVTIILSNRTITTHNKCRTSAQDKTRTLFVPSTEKGHEKKTTVLLMKGTSHLENSLKADLL